MLIRSSLATVLNANDSDVPELFRSVLGVGVCVTEKLGKRPTERFACQLKLTGDFKRNRIHLVVPDLELGVPHPFQHLLSTWHGIRS